MSEIAQCSKCGTEYPFTAEYFVTCKGRLTPRCKVCNRVRTAEWRKSNPERAAATKKKCYEAKKEQYQQHNRERYHKIPIEKQRQQKHDYYVKHREEHHDRSRQWVKNNPEKRRAILNNYIQRNRERINEENRLKYAVNPEPFKQRGKRYMAKKPITAKMATHRRLARKRNLPDTFTAQEWSHCLNWFHGCCAYCGNPAGLLPGMNITADHFIPLNSPKCTGTVASNIIPACQNCNTKKSDTDALEWLVKEVGEHKAKRIFNHIQDYFKEIKK